MKKVNLSILAGLSFFLSGCISISTYENFKKKYTSVSDENVQLAARNKELEEELKNQKEILDAQEAELASLKKTYDDLNDQLQAELAAGSVGLTKQGNNLTVTVGDKVLFKSGSATLQKEGEAVLKKVSDVLKSVPDHLIQVEGHTDNAPTAGALKSRYPSNWELSSARASSVARTLEKYGVPGEVLAVQGVADKKPVADNATAEGRQKNRRVEINLIP